MDKQKYILLLICIIFLLFIINYSFLDKAVVGFLGDSVKDYKDAFVGGNKYVKIDRIIDGDTIVVGGKSIRLLGINSPEKGEAYSEEAKEFLEGSILNKSIKLQVGSPKYGKYHRILAFVFIRNTNINVELVRQGLANVYILNDKKYKDELKNAWKECIEENVNLCEKSKDKCAECLEIEKFKGQTVVFRNKCDFDCSLDAWEIKDEGRKKFIFEDFVLHKDGLVKVIAGEGKDNKEVLYWKDESHVWTKTGDTLFLRDDKGKLVLWERY